ncbi:hypothetical protein HU200_049428 [Digitaria exilis]|uniref:Uncharacterized protein n=1 Tax=Digitaria exilis TaxID=1010633 RepID=A0A835EBC2_9POAL|nr:hypothetical protein HU200_049428 [Digitaria exilis]
MASLVGANTGSGSRMASLLSKLRSTWRRGGVARPRPAAAVRFGYDLHSYSQNFDDGLSSSGHPLSVVHCS